MLITSMKQNDTVCTSDYITPQTIIGFHLTGKIIAPRKTLFF